MLKITNKTKSPIQILIKSLKAPNRLAVKNIPSIGAGKNVYFLKEERATDYIERERIKGSITVEHIK